MIKHHALLAIAVLMASSAPLLAQEVNIYSSRQPELIDPILQAFTAETGIATNVVFMEKGLVERLQAEGERSPADLVLTVDIGNLTAVTETGMIQNVQSAAIDAAIPQQYRDPDGLWFGVTSRARVVYASPERVAPGEITTYEDLADPKWKGRLCTRSGLHNYNIALLADYIAHHGAEAAEAWAAGLKANLARTPEGGDRDQAKAIWAGQCDIALGNTYYVGNMMADPEQSEWAKAIRVDFPVFEGDGTHVNISGMAMTKSAPNRDNALKLMEFLVSPTAQQAYADINFEYPLNPAAQVPDLVSQWGTVKPAATPLAEIAANRKTALEIMERVGYDQ